MTVFLCPGYYYFRESVDLYPATYSRDRGTYYIDKPINMALGVGVQS